ncbi:hypothetical protein MLD38_007817 [Melastoma candidum]|uniref:Uncharacterized protein n=1 Tax=Melastoma candidum TaxID=119954 RepID=A0ACB9RTM8_9MYRT|nr:hypothetical protein MLD38_007817 [Melastoma candidum]
MADDGDLSKASLRWKILRKALDPRRPLPLCQNGPQPDLERVSRRTACGFNLISFEVVAGDDAKIHGADSVGARDVTVCYKLPAPRSTELLLTQRQENHADLRDFDVCNQYNIDNTGLVCPWPSEEVLAYFCLSHSDMFRSRRVIELGSGYGLAGLVIAAATEASEVVISDGNPQVVNYIQSNIDANSHHFSGTEVSPMMLHWSQSDISGVSNSFDIIIASDCTFFKEFHSDLANIIKCLLKNQGPSEAILFSPKRGNSLDKFLDIVRKSGLSFSVTENYNEKVFRQHCDFLNGNVSWPGYEKDHCYPLLIRITR